jgi:hypothetical protein
MRLARLIEAAQCDGATSPGDLREISMARWNCRCCAILSQHYVCPLQKFNAFASTR